MQIDSNVNQGEDNRQVQYYCGSKFKAYTHNYLDCGKKDYMGLDKVELKCKGSGCSGRIFYKVR